MTQAANGRNEGDRGARCAAVLLALVAAAPAQDDPPQVGAEVEALNQAAGAQLGLLRALLEEEGVPDPEDLLVVLEPEVVAGFDPATPPAPVSERQTPAAIVVRYRREPASVRAEPAAVLRGALPHWTTYGGRRIELKVVGVAPGEDGFETSLLVHGTGRVGDETVQVNAHWTLSWSGTAGVPPRIRGLEVGFEERLFAGRPRLFSEATAHVLDPSSGRTALLAFGCETWVHRTDHVGELNWFGHNGVALGDVNGDGLEDLYVAMGTGLPNLLLVRRPDGTLEERGHEAGVAWLDDTKGVLLLDFDNDGDRDLLAAMGPTLVLCRNDGQGVFTPTNSLQAGTTSAFYSLAAADYDLDGDLDVYALRYVQSAYGQSIPTPFQDARNGPRNHLLRNDGDVFTDVTDAVGLGAANDRFSLAASWVDHDDDGDPDLYVANDFGRNNLYRNDDGAFVDVAAEAGVEDQAAGMGVSFADVDRDGDLDLHVANMFSSAGLRVAYQPEFRADQDAEARAGARRLAVGNSLFLNEGGGAYREVSDEAGIRMGRWSWGARFVDLDSDGHDDLIVPNGFMTNEREDDL